MKPFIFVSLLLSACVSSSTETTSGADSLAVASDVVGAGSDTVAVSASQVSDVMRDGASVMTIDPSLPDSLKNQPLAVYHGEYRLNSSSSAEQARMTITFNGNRTFSYSISYNVADFCSDSASGTFTVDGSNTGKDPVEPEKDENRPSYFTGQFTFTLGNGVITVADGIHEFGVGVCNLSGDFFRCDGPCPAIASEDYGVEEGDSVN